MEPIGTEQGVALTADIEDPETTEVFGKYQILERIAVGGMAEVNRALSTSIDGFAKPVALKRILPQLSTDAEFVSMFIAEAKLAVTLGHSNIVQVFDFGRHDESYFIAMELIDGRDMTQILVKQSRRRELVPIEVGCYILSEVLQGLEYAHTRTGSDGRPSSIVHRDVSPHNILVSYDGEVKLTDFGIAKAKNHVSLSKPGIIFGKFAYMSPEQARGHDVDARSDVYSAGIALYETLTGRRLFYADDPVKTLAKVRKPRVPLPSRYNPAITGRLDNIVMKALAPDPAHRYQSCRELAEAMQSHLHELAPDFNSFHLSHFMKELFEDEVGAERFPMAAPRPLPRSSTPVTHIPSWTSMPDPVLKLLRDKLRAEPNLWTLVELGEHLAKVDRSAEATRVLRIAAAKFAQNGLLVQAVAVALMVRDLESWSPDLAAEVSMLPRLAGLENEALLETAEWLGPLLCEDEVGEVLEEVFHGTGPSGMAGMLTSPLLSFLGPDELANLVSLLKLKRIPPNTAIINEGERGRSLYIIARGRLIIYCKNFQGEKVYLSSLSDGDCVGEFSFFTGEKRAASVETLEEVILFEIDASDFDRILEGFPSLTETLLDFYKERVVATLLAKSEVFGVLPPRVRGLVIERFELEDVEADELIIREGERSDGFYLIRSGEVEVFTERKGYVFICKLKSGDFFGEIAAVTGAPRTASVRALGDCEVLRLPGAALQEFGRTHPEMMRVLLRRIAQREGETARRVTAGGLLV